MKRFITFGALLLCASTAAQAQTPAQRKPDAVQLVDPAQARKTVASQSGLLPDVFAGWRKTAAKASPDAALADPANPGLLKEYGFSNMEQATYARDGRNLEVRAARFADAGGAYGAFSFYKQPVMLVEQIGDQGASQNNLILFYRGNILVTVQLEQMTAMSAAELRELASALPRATGDAANLPSLPGYLPQPAYVKNSARYVMGPIGLGLIGAPVPPGAVDFSRGAEVAMGKYDVGSGQADLVLMSYPTPQIAGERARALQAAFVQHPAAARQMVRRSGPIVVLASGDVSEGEVRSLVEAVHYDANVTWNEPTFLGKRNNIGNLVVAGMMLAGIMMLFALVAGLAFGGLRLLMRRLLPDRPADMEIIQLKLRGDAGK